MYCCTIDLITRDLPAGDIVTYPDVQKELLKIMATDQQDRLSGKFNLDPKNPDMKVVEALTRRDTERMRRIKMLLRKVKDISAYDIGLDGSRAIWLIALHAASVSFKKKILDSMKRLHAQDKDQVFYPGIPYLEDSYMITSAQSLEDAKQLFGTQAYTDQRTGELKVFTIIHPEAIATRRKAYDLSPELNKTCKHNMYE